MTPALLRRALSARLRGFSGRPEPVALVDFARLVLAAAVTVGWVRLDDAQTATVGTAAAAVLWAVLTWIARSLVTPNSDPRAADGTPLVPAPAAPGRHERPDG